MFINTSTVNEEEEYYIYMKYISYLMWGLLPFSLWARVYDLVSTESLSSLYQHVKNNVEERGIILKKMNPHELCTLVKNNDTERQLIFFNLVTPFEYQLIKDFPKENLTLFLWEPPSVLPKMYEEETLSCFGRVFTWDDKLVKRKNFYKFYYPELKVMEENPIPFKKKRLCCLVNANKTSNHPNELYSKRVETVRFFEKIGERGFSLYGYGWDEKKFPSYKGGLEDKIEAMKEYRFSICYENITEIEGYITEKIFDSFRAGCVPVYWGASNIETYIPEECFIDKRNYPTYELLYERLKNMEEWEHQGYIEAIQRFLESDEAKLFSEEKLIEIFTHEVLL